MWRVIHSIGRGLRSVRPSQCCPENCCDEGPNDHHNPLYHYHYNESSKAHEATLRHYSTSSWWSPLKIRKTINSVGENTHNSTQAVCLYHPSFTKAGEGIHIGSCDNGNSNTERRESANHHPRCPPWHWQIIQESQKLEKCHSGKEEEREEKRNTEDWRNEWEEDLRSCSTLQALGWGSAAAITWSLFHDWSDHPPCPFKKWKERQKTSNRANRNLHSDPKDVKNQDQKNEEFWSFHKPFKDTFPFENNPQKVFPESPESDNYYKDHMGEIHKVPNFQYNINSPVIYEPNLLKSHECQTQETFIPVYSLQQKFLDLARKVFTSHVSHNVKDRDTLQQTFQDEADLHAVNEALLSLRDEWPNVPDKTDSGCESDLNQSFHSQASSTKLEFVENQYDRNEESNVSKTVAGVISPESPTIEASEFDVPAEEEEDVRDHYEATTQQQQQQPVNNNHNDDNEMKILHDRLFEVVKASHEERLSAMLETGDNIFLDTKPEEMVLYFQAGMLMGDNNSAFNLALCYHLGHGIAQNFENARKLYENASAAGHAWATYNLAVMLSQGLGGPCLPQRAHSLLLQAAKMGVREAQEALSAQEEDKQQHTVSHAEDDEPRLWHCYSEPCLVASLSKEWPSYSSYSTDDLQSLLDEGDCTVGDLSIAPDVSQEI